LVWRAAAPPTLRAIPAALVGDSTADKGRWYYLSGMDKDLPIVDTPNRLSELGSFFRLPGLDFSGALV
jgi:hypothetical protein